MEKISGILPSSARITSVDLKNSGVARSGSPSFGRPQGMSSVERNQQDVAKSAAERHSELMNTRQPGLNPAKDPHVAIIEKMAKDFFNKPDPVESTSGLEAEQDADVIAKKFGPNADLDPNTNSPLSSVNEELDLPQVGAYLDVTA